MFPQAHHKLKILYNLLFYVGFLVSFSYAQPDTNSFAKGEIIIKFKAGFDSPSVASFLENQNLNLVSSITADRWPIVELDFIPNDQHFKKQWALRDPVGNHVDKWKKLDNFSLQG